MSLAPRRPLLPAPHCGSSTHIPPVLPLEFATPTRFNAALEDLLVRVFAGVFVLVGAVGLWQANSFEEVGGVGSLAGDYPVSVIVLSGVLLIDGDFPESSEPRVYIIIRHRAWHAWRVPF